MRASAPRKQGGPRVLTVLQVWAILASDPHLKTGVGVAPQDREFSGRRLAEIMGVSRETIRRIRAHRIYKDVCRAWVKRQEDEAAR